MPTISFSHCTIFYTSAGGARSREVRQILRYLVLGGYHVHSVSFVVYVWKSIMYTRNCLVYTVQASQLDFFGYTPETVYRVAISPRGNLPYIQNYPINNTVFNLIYPVGSWIYLPYKRFHPTTGYPINDLWCIANGSLRMREKCLKNQTINISKQFLLTR